MAKKRKSIHAIQEALVANTKYIAPQGEAPLGDPVGVESAPEPPPAPEVPSGLMVDGERCERLMLLAEYQGVTPEELLNLAIDDLLDLRRRQLAAAQEAREKQQLETGPTAQEEPRQE